MRADGKGWLFVPAGLVDGPLPTHYEPHESPIQNPLYKQQTSPVHKVWAPGKPYNQLAAVGDPKFPYVISTYRLTEHYLAGAMSRWLPWLAELQPELFIEIGKGLAQEKGIRNLDWVRVSSPRGHIRAKALVTDRIGVMHVGGKLIHHVGMPWHWRHVRFIEQFKGPYDGRWLMMSDVCKHCVQAGCLEVCPTGAIIRTEFDTVVIQSDVCNGCRACIAACPFGVIDINPVSGTAQKCTLCYDRLKVGLEPACSKACPTDSIQFGPITELRQRAQKRVEQLRAQGTKAALYGAAPNGALGGLNSFYLLVDKPEVYGLPKQPQLPTRNLSKTAGFSVASAAVLGVLALVGLRKHRMDDMGGPGGGGGGGGGGGQN